MVLNAIIGVGLVLLVGVGGQLSLGHAAFLAVGAYTAANLSSRSTIGLPLELLVAVVLAVFVGMIVGLPSLRLSGLLLTVGTLALGFAGQQLLFIWTPVTGGGGGMTVGPLMFFGTEITLLSASVIVLGISLYLVFNLLHGRTGRALHALRTSDTAARSVGIEVERRRVAAFAMSAALTAAGGVLYGHAVSYLSPDNFGINLSITLVIMVIIGGQRRLLGAVLGAAFVIGLPEQFRAFSDYQGILYGTVLLLIIIFAPGGMVELFDRLLAPDPPHAPGCGTTPRRACGGGVDDAAAGGRRTTTPSRTNRRTTPRTRRRSRTSSPPSSIWICRSSSSVPTTAGSAQLRDVPSRCPPGPRAAGTRRPRRLRWRDRRARRDLRRRPGRGARADRPQRRRQDDPVQRHLRGRAVDRRRLVR